MRCALHENVNVFSSGLNVDVAWTQTFDFYVGYDVIAVNSIALYSELLEL